MDKYLAAIEEATKAFKIELKTHMVFLIESFKSQTPINDVAICLIVASETERVN